MFQRINILWLLAVLFSSCSTYQYNTISSNNSLKTPTNEFITETDSLKVIYNFYGEGPSIHISIQNKLNLPMYVNWQKSALITDKNAVSYAGNSLSINGRIDGSIYNYLNSSSQVNADLNATANLPEGITFIPPHSQVQKNFMSIFKVDNELADTLFRKDQLPTLSGYSVRALTASFTKESSPLIFRSYLTFVIDNQASQQVITSEKEFYISKVITSTLPPDEHLDYQTKPGDLYYTKEQTGYGKVVTGVVVAGALVGVAALSPADSTHKP